MMSVSLRDMGVHTRLAFDGEEALQIAEGYRPDIVLLDLAMPRLDGFDTARRLRERAWAAGMTLIAVTALDSDEDKRRSSEAGFEQHLVKPVESARFVELIRKWQDAHGGATP